jgi:hypothetical protein
MLEPLARPVRAGLFACALVLGFGCGSGAEPLTAAGASAPRWKDQQTKSQEIGFMKKVVVPQMSGVFQSYDAKRYEDFSCKTCHGPGAGHPKAFLPKLAMKDGKLAAFSEKPEIAKFMAERVVPAMASAMGEPPHDEATGKGFGCGGCHAIGAK